MASVAFRNGGRFSMASRRCNVRGWRIRRGDVDLAGGDHVAGQAGGANLKNDRIAQRLVAFAAQPQPHIRQGHPAGFLIAT
jgi:hypothetical protein